MSADAEINENISVVLRTRSVSVSVCDQAVCFDCEQTTEWDAEARLTSRKEIEDLIAVLTHARDVLFPVG